MILIFFTLAYLMFPFNPTQGSKSSLKLIETTNADTEWNKTITGSHDERVADLIPTKDGGFILAGLSRAFMEDKSREFSLRDAALLGKINGNGETQWFHTYGTPNFPSTLHDADQRRYSGWTGVQWNHTPVEGESHQVNSVIQTKDGNLVTAGNIVFHYPEWLENDMWLMKTASNGSILWSRSYGENKTAENAESVIQTEDEGFAIVGYTFTCNGIDNDLFLVKTDAEGIMQWNQTYGGTGIEFGNFMLQNTDSGFILAGTSDECLWLTKTDANGVIQWTQKYEIDGQTCHALIQTTDGGFVVASTFWLVKTDANGEVQWQHSYEMRIRSVIQTFDQGFALTGSMEGMVSVKTDTEGIIQWSHIFLHDYHGKWYSNKIFEGIDLVQTTNESFVLVGNYLVEIELYYTWRIWLIKFNVDNIRSTTTSVAISGTELLSGISGVLALIFWSRQKKKSPSSR